LSLAASTPAAVRGSRLIAAQGVSKRFGAVLALDEVTVELDAPATGLLGANGAGKSTFMKALLGLVRPDAGRLEVLGVDVADRPAELRRRLGYMPERDCLPLDMTARDLVVHLGELRGLPRRAAVLRASEVLFQVGLEEERSRLIRTFSTGMKQRAKLAQALVHSPELVVLDEPTNGLDPSGREEMLSLVRRLSRDLGIAVLLSSHALEDVTRTCDAVVVLRAGRLVRAGRIDEMDALAKHGVLVRATGDVDRFVAGLSARGLTARRLDGGLTVSGAAEDALVDAVRDAAAEAGVGLRELRPAGPTLEDALVEAIE
jgi:ABC-2 type transport system ATP-binding protein